MTLYDWPSVPLEHLNPHISRQVIHTERMTVARLLLKAGAIVVEHHHENEQFSMVNQGKLKFLIGGEEIIVGAGQSLQIPPNLPHRVEALEDSDVLDLFAPVRDDWKRGDDAYLRVEPPR